MVGYMRTKSYKNKVSLCSLPGLVVIGGDSCSGDCQFKSQYCIIDRHFSHWSVVKIVMLVCWKDENKQKIGRWWYD